MSAENESNPPIVDRANYSEADLNKLDTVCNPGDIWCVNSLIHKCNSEGRWYATGQAC